MLRRNFFFVIGLIFFFLFSSFSLETFAFECACDDPSKAEVCTYSRSSIDTIHTFAIYCCDADTLYRLPMYFRWAWENGAGPSVPDFFSKNSFEKYVLSCDVISNDWYPIQNDSVGSISPWDSLCAGGGIKFATGIFQRVDDTVNFANYDGDGDGIVDGFFFIIVDEYLTASCACLGEFSFKTNDTTATGDTIEVSGQRGVEVWIRVKEPAATSQADLTHACVHQWGHQFGLVDLHGNLYSIGFTAMSSVNFYHYSGHGDVCSPYDPYSRAKLGWLDPIEVTDSLSDTPIPGYMLTGQAYKLMHNPQEYFFISNHKLDPPYLSWWEELFPGKGLLIWHVDTTGDNRNYVDHKLVDVENADGLWDSLGIGIPVENDSTGQDSIDASLSIGYYWSFFNSTTKQAFNDTTNPTTDGYVLYNSVDSAWKQTVLTGILVNDIQGAGGDTMWADFYSPNVWWGPDTVYITGDVVVGQGTKLHVVPGTVVKFSTTDDQQGGSDESKCELIIKGTLEALGAEDDSIHFLSISSAPSDSDWHGIKINPSGSAQFNYCDLRHAYTAIYFDTSTHHDTLTHCRFRNNFMHAVKTENSNVLIDSCVIENDSIGGSDETYGILCYYASPSIKNTMIKNCKYGIKSIGNFLSQPSPLIEECGFYNIGEIGIWSGLYTHGTIKQSCFKGAFGKTCIQVDAMATPEIYKCYMASEGDGIPIGMLFGVKSGGTIRRTTIWDYDSCAVQIALRSNADFGTSDSAGNNWFGRTGRYYFASSSSSTIKAEVNYWETDDSTAIDSMIYGNVDFSPFLVRCYEPAPYYPDICSDLPPEDPTWAPCKIAVCSEEKVPKSFAISQNYPNPFNPQTVIKYDLPEPEHVTITIYNILGRKVKNLVNEEQEAGHKSVNWDGKDDQGKDTASGIYFYQIEAGEFSMVKKMVLLK